MFDQSVTPGSDPSDLGAAATGAERRRLAAIAEHDLIETPSEVEFDEITRLTADLLDAPIALITVVHEHEQYVKSRWGADIGTIPRCVAFCAHTIQSNDLFVVPDTHEDDRFVRNPIVTGGLKIRFYAGAPLITREGLRIGALCVIDTVPRHDFSPADRRILIRLATIVAERLKGRRATVLRSRSDVSERVAAQEACERHNGRANELEEIRIRTRQVIQNVSTLAQRASLLALNAQIEAARAGDAGSVFMTVSAEMNRLARDVETASLTAAKLLDD